MNNVNKLDQWEEWILYILIAIEKTALHTIDQIQQINHQLDLAIKTVREKAPKTYPKELLELLFEHPYSKIEYVTNKLNVEGKAASRYLRKLEDIGMLNTKKIGREKYT